MAAIVKANSSLTAGGLAVLGRNISASDSGQVVYTVNYACLSQYADTWAQSFKSGAQPPTPLPVAMLRLDLTRTPQLTELQSQSSNGLTYFNATYSAGIASDLVITRSSETRNISWVASDVELEPGFVRRTVASFDYISTSVTVEGTNSTIQKIDGTVSDCFNARNVNANDVLSNKVANLEKRVVVSTSIRKNRKGEYLNSVTSTGIYTAFDAQPFRLPTESGIPVAPQPTPPAATTNTSTTGSSGTGAIQFPPRFYGGLGAVPTYRNWQDFHGIR